MEQHEEDPTASTPEDPWKTVADEFVSLGGHLRDTYRRVANDDGPSENEINSAFSTLAGVWNQIAESVSSALSDPATREHLKDAAGSLANALGSTLSQLGDEIQKSAADEEE